MWWANVEQRFIQPPHDPEGPLKPCDINVTLPATAKDPEVACSICHTAGRVINSHQRALRFRKAAVKCGGRDVRWMAKERHVVLIKHVIEKQLRVNSLCWPWWVIITYSFLFPGCSSVHPEGTSSGPSCTQQWWLFCEETRRCIMKDKQDKRDIFSLKCKKRIENLLFLNFQVYF